MSPYVLHCPAACGLGLPLNTEHCRRENLTGEQKKVNGEEINVIYVHNLHFYITTS